MASERSKGQPQGKEYAYKSVANIFSLPPPIKFLFNKVPLVIYPPNSIPARAVQPSKKARLYVFSTSEDAAAGRPSFNPTCLKWQTFLRIAHISFKLIPSNNHASPSGILPFLIPAHSESEAQQSSIPVPHNKLRKYVKDIGREVEETGSPRYEPYQSLIDNAIRKAWLYSLYLAPENAHMPLRLYINPTSSSTLVRKSLSHTLSTAARRELDTGSSMYTSSISIFGGCSQGIDVERVYRDATEAFQALDVVLGDSEWFFRQKEPGEFDASVFAYTQLLLDSKMGWRDRRLVEIVEGCENLVAHRLRILERYYEVVYE